MLLRKTLVMINTIKRARLGRGKGARASFHVYLVLVLRLVKLYDFL